MRFQEFKPLKPFKATVRLKTDKSVVLTLLWADSQTAARRNLAHLYGTENVLSLTQIALSEAKQLTAQDQQVKAIQTQAKQLTQQAKLAKARKSLTKAQTELSKATSPVTQAAQ